MQTATSETESKSIDPSLCGHHYTLRAPCPKGRKNEPSVAQGGGGVDRSKGSGQGCSPGVADRGHKDGQDNEKDARKQEQHAVSETDHCAGASKKEGGDCCR